LPKILDFIDVFGAEARASENLSSVFSEGSQEVWATFRERLERIGFKSVTLERHDAVVLCCIRGLREEGFLDPDTASESEASTQYYIGAT